MKTSVLSALLTVITVISIKAQDLPSPSANLQTLSNGSYVIAMDNTLQANAAGNFNLKAYGLVVYLLNNNVKIKWSIKAGKSKDAADFTATAEQFQPTLISGGTSKDFKAGPFVIDAADTTGVAALISSFYTANSITGNNRPKVYRLTASASNIDIRYDMTGFIPKAAVLNDGNSSGIHIAYMTNCSIPTANYATSNGSNLLTNCFTFASEPHNNTAHGSVISAIKNFVQRGGNFLAQCEAVVTYENYSGGRFHTTNGITITNTNVNSNSVIYPNADLSFSQFEGVYSIRQTGSASNWTLASGSSFVHNEHNHATGTSQTPIGASVAKLNGSDSKGGLVFYIGNHNFNSVTNIESINGIRMYMNAFLTPVSINSNCSTGSNLSFILPVKLVSFQGNMNNNKKVSLQWVVAENEIADMFEVEKSFDAVNFSTAAVVFGSDKAGMENYQFSETMNADKVFYRLRMTDKSQVVNYSKTLMFQATAVATDNTMKILNNPATDRLTFNFRMTSSQEAEVKIFDIGGRVQMKQQVNGSQGNNLVSIQLAPAMQSGIYIVEVNTGTERYTAKFVKQ
jgi:hypothetical protein